MVVEEYNWREELRQVFAGKILEDEPLSQHTTLRVGGPVDALVYPQNVEQLQAIQAFCATHKIHSLILGAGSNLLVKDGGFRGIAICLEENFRKMERVSDEAEHVLVRVQAGVSVPRLILWAAGEGLSGLEKLTGIPGSMGGVLKMNAGTRAGEVKDVVREVTVVNKRGKLQTFSRDQLDFSYRKLNLQPGSIVVECVMALKQDDPISIKQRVKEMLDHRSATQPVGQSAGCIFKNPGKQSAGKLLDDAGLKDVRVRGARVSDLHANFILNQGDATAKDILVLIQLMKDRVKERFNQRLETEITVIGEAA